MSFYKYITERRKDSPEFKQIMEDICEDLLLVQTNELKPGILLGLIQSGKTRAFIGVIARAFDNGYDIAVVLTKNSVALVEQTIKRLKTELSKPIESNRLYMWDIIKIQKGQLTGYVLEKKLIFVVKKEAKNLDRLIHIFESNIHNNKKVLIVDDEADQASVSFVPDKSQEDGIDFAKIASQISHLRKVLNDKCSFLQVTATPYSLYLQPEDANLNQTEYAPNRPAFTHLLPPHEKYIGGNYYFEESLNQNSPASFLHIQVPEDELQFINQKPKTTSNYDQRVLNNLLNSDKIEKIRTAIFTFLVGGAIRQIQDHSEDDWHRPCHCAFVMHTSTQNKIHEMQQDLVRRLIQALTSSSTEDLEIALTPSYKDLKASVLTADLPLPSFNKVVDLITSALQNRHIGVVEVNSRNQVSELLGEDGQLRLDNPFNIFVGGQSLDRGITIDHLIGLYYGRNPKTFQMDTVLQHSRMYGSRSLEDLTVTRFYTSARVYHAMRSMHWFDKDLRENLEKDIKSAVAQFIAKSGNTIIPANPNKLKASDLISFKAFSRMLPVGFQTRSKSDIQKTIADIDQYISSHKSANQDHFVIDKDAAIQIIRNIRETFSYEPQYGNVGLEWDIDPFIKAIEIALKKNNRDTVIIYHKTGRMASRYKHEENSFYDAPDDGKTDLPNCRKLAQDGPVLMLLKQVGAENNKWRNASFYWPVLIMPQNMPNYVYCRE